MDNGSIFLFDLYLQEIEGFVEECKAISCSDLDLLKSGNLSCRLNKEYILITPSGVSFDCITKEIISIVKINTKDVIYGLRPSSDLDIHIQIYKKDPKVNSVIHTHSHYATIMSIVGMDIPVVCSMHADYFGQPIKCLPYLNHRKKSVGNQITNFKVENTCLLGKHGSFSFGKSIKETVEFALVTEEICKLYFHVCLIKTDISPLKDEDVLLLNNFYKNKYGN